MHCRQVQIDIDASVNVGKRHHSFDDPYFADGTPCFHHGREGIVEDLLCVDVGFHSMVNSSTMVS